MASQYGEWRYVPPNLPIGPHFPAAETEAARQRVIVKRRVRRMLKAMGIEGVIVR